MSQSSKIYSLKLVNGLAWNITALDGVDKWLDDFAYIMGLSHASIIDSGSGKIIFCKMGEFKTAIEYYYTQGYSCNANQSENNWVLYDNRRVRTWICQTTTDAICEIDNGGSYERSIGNMYNSLFPIYLRVQDLGGLAIHSALIELDGRGVLLVASSNTGKSTSCKRLPSYFKPLGDDEALVVYDSNREYRAHAFPTWSEHYFRTSNKSWNIQYSVPICGIFFLQQAERDEVIPLSNILAAISINESATSVSERFWNKLDNNTKRNLKIKMLDNSCRLTKSIPFFILCQTLYGSFWEEIEKIIVNNTQSSNLKVACWR